MPIKLAENFRAVFYAPFYAAEALGFYASEGVEVEFMNSPAPAAAQSGLLDGTIDLSWGGPLRVLKARDQDPNSPLVSFCEVVARDPFFLVGRSNRPFRLTDLPRLRFATVSEVPTPWLCLQHELRLNGIDPDRLDRVADRTMADNLKALGDKELDVAQMFEPYVSMALKAGIGSILHAASARGPTTYTTFLATRGGIGRNRDAFAAMVRAVRRTQCWISERSTEELTGAVARFFPDVMPDLLASSLLRYRDADLWARYPEVSREGFARLSKSLLSGGFIARMYAYEDCVHQSLN